MSRFIRQNADVEIWGITFGQFYRNACDRFEYYGGDPEAAAQNFCCEIEKMMGIFPNTSPSEPKDAGSGEGQELTIEQAQQALDDIMYDYAPNLAANLYASGFVITDPSKEGHEMTRDEQERAIANLRTMGYLDDDRSSNQWLAALHAAGFAVTRTATSGAKPGEVR